MTLMSTEKWSHNIDAQSLYCNATETNLNGVRKMSTCRYIGSGVQVCVVYRVMDIADMQ
jgi:hypothetical protein